MDLAIDMEQLKMHKIPYCGGTIDIAKFFDQVSRILLMLLARAAGIPEPILSAYMRFQEHLAIHNTIAGGIGIKYYKRCGIPQGDPLSMMFIALIMRPWVLLMQLGYKIRPSVLVDDIFIMANGPNMLQEFVGAMNATHSYLIDLGAKLAPKKSFNFASTATARIFFGGVQVEHVRRHEGASL